MTQEIRTQSVAPIFTQARTHRKWLPKAVETSLLHKLYAYTKTGPTSANCCPLRIVFVCSSEGKERLRPALAAGNVEKTMSAPVTAILATDVAFPRLHKQLFPPSPDMFSNSSQASLEETAFRNATLQAGYFILASRSLGLDCGPMSGFDSGAVDRLFFPQEEWRSNFLCNLGFGDAADLGPRLPRLDFSQACRIV